MSKYLYSFVNLILRRGSFVVLTFILGNLVTPEELGIFLAHMMIIQYGVVFFSFDIQSGVIKYLGVSIIGKDKNLFFTSGIFLVLSLGVIAIVFFVFFSSEISDILKLATLQYYYLFPPLVLLSLIGNYLFAVLRNELVFNKIFIILLVSNIILIIATYLFVNYGLGIYGIIISLYISYFISIIGSLRYVIQYVKIEFDRKLIEMSRKLLKFSFLIYLGTTLMVLDNYIDIFFINYFMEKENVALYNYAIIFGFILISIGDSISSVTYPQMVRLFSRKDLKSVNQLYSRSIDFTFFFVSILSFLILINIDQIVLFLLPEYYLKIKELLLPLFIGITLFATISSVGTSVTAYGKPQISLWSLVPAVLLNVILNIILIPKIGVTGAAIATSTSFLLRAIVGFVINKTVVGMHYRFSRIMFGFIAFLILILGMYYMIDNLLEEYMIFSFYLMISYRLFIYKNKFSFLKFVDG